jgi:hypothetical protein
MAQMMECLPSKCKTLSSNTNSTKKGRKNFFGRFLSQVFEWKSVYQIKSLGYYHQENSFLEWLTQSLTPLSQAGWDTGCKWHSWHLRPHKLGSLVCWLIKMASLSFDNIKGLFCGWTQNCFSWLVGSLKRTWKWPCHLKGGESARVYWERNVKTEKWTAVCQWAHPANGWLFRANEKDFALFFYSQPI